MARRSSELTSFLLAEWYVPLRSLRPEFATAVLAEYSIVDRAILHLVSFFGSLYGRPESGPLEAPLLVQCAVADHRLDETCAQRLVDAAKGMYPLLELWVIGESLRHAQERLPFVLEAHEH